MAMKKGENLNKPAKGDTIKVEPIRSLKDIATIKKKILSGNHRDLALFVLGINTNLRASDLLALTVSQVKGLNPGDEIVLKESKTGKERRINLNRACIEAIRGVIDSRDSNDGYLFMGQRGPLTVPTLSRMVKTWCSAVNLKGNYAAHTLRKTWGYHQRVTFNVDIPTLMVCFNHSSQKQTLDYLCVQPDEIKSVYNNEL